MPMIEDLPDVQNIPDLAINVEGLKRHSFLMRLVSNPALPAEDQKLRTWLLHTVTTAARHYTRARDLVQAQKSADQQRDGGDIFYMLDICEQIEGSVMAAHRACMAIRRLAIYRPEAADFVAKHSAPLKGLCSIRNQYEHMHTQITSNQTGAGPILMSFGAKGKTIQFRCHAFHTASLHELIKGAYVVVAKMYPGFNPESLAESPGPTQLTISARIIISEVAPRDGNGIPSAS